jgi:hypothetical protein
MLTSFFGKSNPVNYLLLGIFIFLGYTIGSYQDFLKEFSIITLAEHILGIGICIISMLLVDFIIRKNALTKANTFGILLFSCFLLMFPIIFSELDILLSNIFLLFALRRILSLKSEKNLEKKVLDASIWIAVAMFFYFYACLFFGILFIAILRKKHTTYKHLLIPFVGLAGVFTLATSYHFMVYDSFDWFLHMEKTPGLDYSTYNSAGILIPLTVVATLLVWTGVHRIFTLSSVSKKDKPNYLLLMVIASVSIVLVLTSPDKKGGEIIFLLAPTAIIVAGYIESSKEFWFKEMVLWLTLLLPILLIFIR